MKEEIKKKIIKELLAVGKLDKHVNKAFDEIEALISSYYISKDKVMEIAEFSLGYGYGRVMTLTEKEKYLAKFKEILKKEYGI